MMVLLAAPAAQADTVVNPWAGNWATQVDHIPGTVAFRVISEAQGTNDMPSYGGHLCADPTTYYHGDFTDQPPSSPQQTGTMTACVDNGSLVGRWSGSGDMGSFTIQLQSPSEFLGSYTDDMNSSFQADYTGTFQSHFPGDGCCTTSGGGGGGGGGTPGAPPSGQLALPTQFCPASGPASGKCAPRKALTVAEKYSAVKQQAELLDEAEFSCASLTTLVHRIDFVEGLFFKLELDCEAALKSAAAVGELVNDPPNFAFNVPTIARFPSPPAHAAAPSCPSGLSASNCTALSNAAANFNQAATAVTSALGSLADQGNKVTAAVQSHSTASAFFQGALAKVDSGILVLALYYQASDGKALADLLTADHLNWSVRARRVRKAFSKLPASGLSASQRQMLKKQLASLKGTFNASVLGTPLPSGSYLASYLSTSLSDLAAIVYGAYRNNHFSAAVEQTLEADLQNAQSVCSNSNQRISAMNKFVSDASQAGDYAQFLAFGAKPLLAQTVAASNCQ
jgi:hypothetical protein